jgi:hypothetical protein
MSSTAPRAVLEAEERANKLQEELIANKQQAASGQTPPADGTPPASETPPVDTAAAQGAENPAPSGDSQPPTPAPGDDWEHRFKVLQGKYNSEVPRFAQENKDLKSRLEQLESEMVQLKATPPEPLVKQEEIDEYGEGLIDVARRIAQEELGKKQSEIDALKAQITQISTATTNTATNDFFRSLDAIAPEWKQINEDPNFLKWLDEIDELTGEPRQSLLSKAEQARDASRVGKFFTSFKKTSSSWAASSANALEQQVVPPTNKAPDTPPSKKVWTRGEIAEFYDRMRRGVVTDADAIAIEADITAASIEGRIR